MTQSARICRPFSARAPDVAIFLSSSRMTTREIHRVGASFNSPLNDSLPHDFSSDDRWTYNYEIRGLVVWSIPTVARREEAYHPSRSLIKLFSHKTKSQMGSVSYLQILYFIPLGFWVSYPALPSPCPPHVDLAVSQCSSSKLYFQQRLT